MQPVAANGEEREVDQCVVLVSVDDARGDLEHAVRPIQRRYEQATPAGRRAAGPVGLTVVLGVWPLYVIPVSIGAWLSLRRRDLGLLLIGSGW